MPDRLGLAVRRCALELVLLVAASALAACWSGASSEDAGAVCFPLMQPGGPAVEARGSAREQSSMVQLGSDAALTLNVETSACLSSACTRHRRASCSVLLSGSELFVSSHFHWEEKGAYPSGCTDDCAPLSAQCQTPPLPAGTYVVRHGGDAFTLRIPGQLATGCLSSASSVYQHALTSDAARTARGAPRAARGRAP